MLAFVMGSPVSGRVAYFCALDRNEGFFLPSVLHYFAMGSPYGSSDFPPTRYATKSSLNSWSVFLQDGVTLFGSDSTDLISIEGITSVGLLGAFFRLSSGVTFGHPEFVRSALKQGEFHNQLSSLQVRTLCVSLSPTKE